tara:strand:+ start:1156 stop:1272 length:117 start_codon:yes stop_codon:yes gene_type:complete
MIWGAEDKSRLAMIPATIKSGQAEDVTKIPRAVNNNET